MGYGRADVREAVADLPNLEVEPGFVVSNELSRIGLRIDAAGAKEYVAKDGQVAAEYSRILVGNDESLATVVEAQQGVPKVLENPHRGLRLPAWQNAAR